MTASRDPIYAGYCYPVEIISSAVRQYFLFPLSLRMVEQLLAARGIVNRRRTGTPDRRAKGTPLWRWRASTLGTPFVLLAA